VLHILIQLEDSDFEDLRNGSQDPECVTNYETIKVRIFRVYHQFTLKYHNLSNNQTQSHA